MFVCESCELHSLFTVRNSDFREGLLWGSSNVKKITLGVQVSLVQTNEYAHNDTYLKHTYGTFQFASSYTLPDRVEK